MPLLRKTQIFYKNIPFDECLMHVNGDIRLVESRGQHGNFVSMLFNGKVASKEITARGRFELSLDSGKGPNLSS